MSASLRLLLIEDNPGDAGLLEAMLEDQEGISLDWVQSLDDGMKLLTEGGYDALLLDLSLPDSDGLESVATTVLFDTQVPVIVLTGLASEDMAFHALREGAQDYLVKGTIDGDSLLRTIRFAIERCSVRKDLAPDRPPGTQPRDATVRALVAPVEARLAAMADHLQGLAHGGANVILVCADRPAGMMRARLMDEGLGVQGMQMIDVSGSASGADGQTHIVEDPRDLDLVGLEIERACAAIGPRSHVVIDSINSILVHHRVEAVSAFIHGLSNRLRLLGISADFIVHDTQDWPFLADRFSFLDEAARLGTRGVLEPDPSFN